MENKNAFLHAAREISAAGIPYKERAVIETLAHEGAVKPDQQTCPMWVVNCAYFDAHTVPDCVVFGDSHLGYLRAVTSVRGHPRSLFHMTRTEELNRYDASADCVDIVGVTDVQKYTDLCRLYPEKVNRKFVRDKILLPLFHARKRHNCKAVADLRYIQFTAELTRDTPLANKSLFDKTVACTSAECMHIARLLAAWRSALSANKPSAAVLNACSAPFSYTRSDLERVWENVFLEVIAAASKNTKNIL